ncbi:hypothetical protein FOC84_10315 [Achromobacter pestifer]|uniref:Uncharacterized protein n=1 Tax=Achromobacter pestifer TaxID=1353889 RepID=A0A7D4HQF6_9BURK|nr:hypothetical protein [Achromobacter pestifer]QKH35319.1 hypothetical protein FOC84_10315 [Achromobacter pestifer]
MEKTEQPDQQHNAEQQIRPLSAEEIQAVSGGWGPNRLNITFAPQKNSLGAGKTLYTPR